MPIYNNDFGTAPLRVFATPGSLHFPLPPSLPLRRDSILSASPRRGSHVNLPPLLDLKTDVRFLRRVSRY